MLLRFLIIAVGVSMALSFCLSFLHMQVGDSLVLVGAFCLLLYAFFLVYLYGYCAGVAAMDDAMYRAGVEGVDNDRER